MVNLETAALHRSRTVTTKLSRHGALWLCVRICFNRLIQSAQEQRAIEHLKGLDDYLLRDLGISHAEIESVVRGRQCKGEYLHSR